MIPSNAVPDIRYIKKAECPMGILLFYLKMVL